MLNGLDDGSTSYVGTLISFFYPSVSAGRLHHHRPVLDAAAHRPPQSHGLFERSASLPSDAGLFTSGPHASGKDLQ